MRRMRPETLGVIVSQEIREAVVTNCLDLRDEGVRFLYHFVRLPDGESARGRRACCARRRRPGRSINV